MSRNAWKLLLAAVLLAGGGYFAYTRLSDTPGADGIVFQETAIERGDIESMVSTSGAVKAKGTVDVGSEISGLIAEILVDFNDTVSKDQMIARVDPRTYETRLAQARAELQIAEADLAQARQNLQKSRATLELRKLQLKREQQIHEKGYGNESALDEAEVNVAIATADAAVAEVQITNREATIAQRRAMEQNAEIDLAKTYIRSPVDGIVLSRNIEVGQTVAASLQAPILFTIAEDLEEIEIEASVDESDIGKIKVGQPARFSVDAYPDHEFEGTVQQIRLGAIMTANVVTYTVIITARNWNTALMPGMTANLAIRLGRETGILKLANQALTFRPPAGYGDDEDEAESAGGPQGGSGGPQSVFRGGPGGPGGQFGGGGRPPWMNDGNNQQRGSVDDDSMPPAVRALRELDLSQSQREKLRDTMRGIFQGGEPDVAAITRQLSGVLTADQLKEFETLLTEFAQGTTPGVRSAKVWVRDGRSGLKSMRVRVGISDSEFTHLVDSELKEGDPVVIRVEREES